MKTFVIGIDPVKKNTDSIRERFDKFWEPYFEDPVALDFSGVKRVDMEGAKLLSHMWKKTNARRSDIFATNLSDSLAELFRLTGLESKIRVGSVKRMQDLAGAESSGGEDSE